MRSGMGAWIMALAGLAGAIVSLANYLTPDSGVAETYGALLVVVSTIILVAFASWLAGGARPRALRIFLGIATLLDIAGTAFAALLLDSNALLVAMAVAALGWLLQIFSGRRSAT